MDRLLLAVDGSDNSMRAARLAGEVAAGTGAVVDVLHVIPDRSREATTAMSQYGHLEEIYVTERDVARSTGRQIAERAAKAVRDGGGTVDTTDVAAGDAAHLIVAAADEADADAIVMGRRGHGALGGLFMGSVSTKVGHLTSRTLITTE